MASAAVQAHCAYQVTTENIGPATIGDQEICVPSFAFKRHLTIEWGQCDPAGIVFNPRFFEMFDVNAWMLFEAALGIGAGKLAEIFDIVGIPLVDARANFLKPAKFGDTVEIISRVVKFRRSSFDIEHKITIDDALAVEVGETRVWATRDKNDVEEIRATAVPSDVIARFG